MYRKHLKRRGRIGPSVSECASEVLLAKLRLGDFSYGLQGLSFLKIQGQTFLLGPFAQIQSRALLSVREPRTDSYRHKSLFFIIAHDIIL